MYEVAATPGELLQAKLQDIDPQQDHVRQRNKTHGSQTIELYNEGLQYLRSYLKSHPSVEDPFSTVTDEPLWTKQESTPAPNVERQDQSTREKTKMPVRATNRSKSKR